MQYRFDVETKRRLSFTPEAIFAVLQTERGLAAWWGEVKHRGPDTGTGMVISFEHDGKVTETWTVAAVESSRRVVYEIDFAGAGRVQRTISLIPDGDGTAVTWREIGKADHEMTGSERKRLTDKFEMALGMLGKATANKESMFSQAEAYERYMGRWSRLIAPAFVSFSGVEQGDDVLDIGSGTGVLSAAVRAANETGHITGIDPARAYVTFALDNRRDARVHFEVGDAQQLRFAGSAFDKTLSLLVINFIPEAGLALREMIRVTKPGGVIAAAVWDYADGMQMLRRFWDEAVASDPSSAPLDEGLMALSRKGELSSLWRRHGLENVEETALEAVLNLESFDDYWAPFLLGQGPAGSYVAKLPKDAQAALADRLRKRLLGEGPDHAIELRARAWVVKGTVAANASAK